MKITKSTLHKLIKQSVTEQIAHRWNRDYEETEDARGGAYRPPACGTQGYRCGECQGCLVNNTPKTINGVVVGLDEQQHRWNKKRKMDADFWKSVTDDGDKEPYAHGEYPYHGNRSDDLVNGDYEARDKKNDNKFTEQNKVGKDKYDDRKRGTSNYDNNPMFPKRPWNYKRDETDESGNGKDANGFSISGPSQVTKGKGSTIPEQAASSEEIPLGSKANRPQPGDIYVAESDYQPLFFKVIEPKKSSKYGVVYQLAKIAAKAERGIFAPDPKAEETSSRFHRTYHTGQKAFEIGGDVGVATKWNGRPVKAPGYFRERAEHLKELGNGMPGISSAPKIGDVFVTQDGKFLKVSQKYKSNRTGEDSYMLMPIGSKGNKPALSSFTGAPMSAVYNPRKKGFEFDNGRVPGFATPYKGGNSLYSEQKFITKSQLKKLIESAIHEQMHDGDFAAWGDEESAPAAPKEVPSKTEPASTSAVKKGDIFVCSWGYDQTNIDFYEVVAVSKTGKSVKIDRMTKERVGQTEGRYEDRVIPVATTGEVETRKIGRGYKGLPEINTKYGYATLWDGKPQNQTASGYGH